MKYLLLVYASEPDRWEHPIFLRHPEFQALPAEERETLHRQAEELWTEISGSSELVGGTALADPVSARTGCRRRSPRCTTRPRAPRTPTGPRSPRSTACSTRPSPTRWSP